MPKKKPDRLEKKYRLSPNARPQPVAESTYGVILAVEARSAGTEKGAVQDAVVLKTVQSIDPNERDNYDPAMLKKAAESLEKEIAFLVDMDAEYSGSLAEHSILPILDHGTFDTNFHHDAVHFDDFPEGFPAFTIPRGQGLTSFINPWIHSRTQGNRPFDFLTFIRWCCQMATAVLSLHAIVRDGKPSVHRDLKPQNLLLWRGDLYLIDFGGGKRLRRDKTFSFMGSPLWTAPEIAIPRAENESYKDEQDRWLYEFGTQADSFGMGEVMYWLLTILLARDSSKKYEYLACQVAINKCQGSDGRPLVHDTWKKWGTFGGLTQREKERVKQELISLFKYSDPQTEPADFGEIIGSLIRLIEALLHPLPNERPSARQLLEKLRAILEKYLKISMGSAVVDMPEAGTAGSRCPVSITQCPEWLFDPKGTLSITLGGIPVEKINDDSVLHSISAQTPALPDRETEVALEILFKVAGVEAVLHSASLAVNVTADQLWDKGDYPGALAMEPDRREWLDWIRTRVGENRDRCCQWFEWLNPVYEALAARGEDRKYPGFNRLFFALEDKCESGIGGWKFPGRTILLAGVLGFLFIALAIAVPDHFWGPSVSPAFLSVVTEPRDAGVRIEGLDRSYTSGMQVEPGRQYTIVAEKENYEAIHHTTKLLSSGSNKIILPALKKIKSDFFVETEPNNATITFPDTELKFEQGISLDIGKSYWVRVEGPGYETKKLQVEMGKEDKTITVVLKRLPVPVQAFEKKEIAVPGTRIKITLRYLPGTERFMMGQTQMEKAYLIKEFGQKLYDDYWSDESPSHPVKVEGFWMAEAPVTRGQFRLFLKEDSEYKAKMEKDKSAWIFNKSTDWKWKVVQGAGWDSPGFDQDDTHPVVCVSHRDALAFIKWLNKKTGQQFILPTEAQWEYAARGGTQTIWFWGDVEAKACRFANVTNEGDNWKRSFPCKDGYKFTSPVGPLRFSINTIKPNGFKLYDMLGNVWEWCSDNCDKTAYRQRPLDKVTPNPVIRNASDQFVLRGGSWISHPGGVRAAHRHWNDGSDRGADTGFRLCCLQVRQDP